MAEYLATSLIAHPDYCCPEGQSLDRCPPKLLAQFIKDGLAKLVGKGGPAESLMPDQDQLSPLDRDALTKLWLNGKLADGTPIKDLIPAKKTWTDEEIRVGIRNVVSDLTILFPEDAELDGPQTDLGTTAGQPQ